MTTIYVVTHPQATHHTEGLVGDWYDSVLTDRGLRHAQQIAVELSRRLAARPESSVRLVSSDLIRARQTADAITEIFDLPVTLDERLREQHHGAAEGQPVGAHPYNPVPRTGDRMHFVSGPGMESRAVWAQRVYAAMTDIYHDPADTTIVVTHGGSLTYVIASWIGIPFEAADRVKFQASPGSLTVLHDDDINGDHVVAELNSTDHLL
ncbi:histidine phosphatase family protein [Enteractinococcus helveticum]|uniref:Phosphoglycerate kinase n=1 Tax=Enteractinococcus helveticum TaxID=1837282 RepID=A0A1B7LYX1_9MICC|nr:histidine phosphatase family protein [Enteractinococcus helveticum]OAV60582.1 hypothetical protein A6F49_11565 [Enteractinococcus helveticum]